MLENMGTLYGVQRYKRTVKLRTGEHWIVPRNTKLLGVTKSVTGTGLQSVTREDTPFPPVAANFQTNALKNLTHSLSSPFLINSIAFDSRIKIKKLQFQTGLKIFLTSSETQRSITYRIYSSNSYCTLIAREISSNRNTFPLLSLEACLS